MTRASLVIILLFGLGGLRSASAQTAESIILPAEISAEIAPGETDSYTFTATAGGIVSLFVRADGEFDPVVTLLDSSGRAILVNDDYAYPDTRDALLEAISIPRTGAYTVQVSGYNGSSGQYTLRAYPGFSEIAANETFSQSGGWELVDGLTVRTAGGQMSAAMSGQRALGAAVYQFADPMTDAYVQAQFTDIENPSGWSVGLALRQVSGGYYAVIVNDQGFWRFGVVNAGTMTIIRDWTTHPNIVAGQTEFTLGAIVNGVGFDFYYNGGYIGSAADSTIARAGSVGIVVGTPASLSSTTNIEVSQFFATTPHFANGARVIPQQLIISSAVEMERALEVRHVIDASGTMALTVPESTVEYARDGVNRLMLGRGTTYTHFAMGAMVEIQGARAGLAGCGLIVNQVDENDYVLAFFDQSGGYGLSQREGEVFLPGVFGENPEFAGGLRHLLLIADANTLYYYLDGILVGSLPVTARAGEVGTAVVNYETITTTCRYQDVWLWRWE